MIKSKSRAKKERVAMATSDNAIYQHVENIDPVATKINMAILENNMLWLKRLTGVIVVAVIGIYGLLWDLKTGMNNLKIDMNNLKIDMNNLKTDMNNLKIGMNNLKTDMNNLKIGQRELKTSFSNMEGYIKSIKSLLYKKK